jgi:cysteinyl-tRNA synthetase
MVAGARVDVAPYKRDPMDFVLWKPSKPGEPAWPSPWGQGRPGWHLECSAMAGALLGDTFDIHGGGIDLVFPHHENEIAQSRCAHGTAVMAKYWLHNGFLQVEGEKMSKSLGNFVTVRELLEGWKETRWPGEVIRLAMLTTHYRQPIDFSERSLWEAQEALTMFAHVAHSIDGDLPSEEVTDALCDDLNTPRAIAELHRLSKSAWQRTRELHERMGMPGGARLTPDYLVPGRQLAAGLKMLGINIDGYRGRWDRLNAFLTIEQTSKAESLVKSRAAARKAKNFAEADRIRAELDAMGIALKDAKDPKTGELVTKWEVKR